MVLIPSRPPTRGRKKKAFLTGITGQDGSYLAELLLSKGYEVHGLIRRASTFNTERIEAIYKDPREEPTDLYLHFGDLSDGSNLAKLLGEIRPDEVYNLGAQSHVKVSFDNPVYTADVDGLGALRMLEAIRSLDYPVRFYQASSSELFGKAHASPQNEETPFRPRSPYGCAKAYAFWQAVNYREAYGLFVCNGIMFNHESPRRGKTFVTRKVTRAAARISLGLQEHLYLGNLDARRDWGFAGDYVEAMWRMMQIDQPTDYVIATGETHSVREFAQEAFSLVDLDLDAHLRIDEAYLRPTEVDELRGDASKAQRELGWQPTMGFTELVRMMVRADVDLARREKALLDGGHVEHDRLELS